MNIYEGKMARKLMTTAEVAEFTQLSAWKINMLVRDKKIPFLKIDGCRRFDPDEIDRWLTTKRGDHPSRHQRD